MDISSPSAKINPSEIWTVGYESWQDALEASRASNGADAFGNKIWIDKIKEQLISYKSALANGENRPPPRSSSLPWIISILKPQKVIDFGGSSGWMSEYLASTICGLNLTSYTVIEIQAIIQEMMGMDLLPPLVSFRPLEDVKGHHDFLYINSVLQYFEDNRVLFQLIETIKPLYIFCDDLIVHDGNIFATQNFYNCKIPYRFMDLQKYLNEMKYSGFELICRDTYFPNGKVPDTYVFPIQAKSLSLLFKKC